MADGTEALGELVQTAYQVVLKCVDEKKQATHVNGQPVSVIKRRRVDMKKNSSHFSDTIHPYELPLMVNPFARSIRDRRFQFLEEPGTDGNELCFSPEGIANSLVSVEIS
jgi:hypothetical protein